MRNTLIQTRSSTKNENPPSATKPELLNHQLAVVIKDFSDYYILKKEDITWTLVDLVYLFQNCEIKDMFVSYSAIGIDMSWSSAESDVHEDEFNEEDEDKFNEEARYDLLQFLDVRLIRVYFNRTLNSLSEYEKKNQWTDDESA